MQNIEMMVTFAQYCIHGEKYYIHFFWWHAASSELMFLFENLPFRFFFKDFWMQWRWTEFYL